MLNPSFRYYMHIALAALVALVCGVCSVRLFNRSNDFLISLFCYVLYVTPLVAAYFWALRKVYGFSSWPRIQWFIVRCVLVDVFYCLFIAVPLTAMFNLSEFTDFYAMYHVLWLLDLVLIGRYFTDLRPFVRGQSNQVPWPHHDGKKNCPEALFFKTPPDSIGDIVSAGSSIRVGEDMPTLQRMVILTLFGAGLACTVSTAVLYVAVVRNFSAFPFMAPVYAIVGGLGAVVLLVRKRICSYVGTLGAVQYRQIDDASEEWSVHYADFQHLKTSTSHEYFNGQYQFTNETRRFETTDGSIKNEYCFHWNDPEVTRASRDGLPNVQAMFWQKIESIWAMRE